MSNTTAYTFFPAWIMLLSLFLTTGNVVYAHAGGDANGSPGDAAEASYAAQTEEVLLSFNYRGVGNVYVSGLYDYELNKMFLPVSELFGLLQIYYEPSRGDFSLSGNFLSPDQPFSIYFDQQRVVFNNEVYTFEADDFRIGEMDYFASPGVLEEVFGLYFSVNMNALTLSLETDHVMPVEEAAERQQDRQQITSREVSREHHPLAYDRERKLMDFGFLDYNITGSFRQDAASMNYSLTGGLELLGGDIQGSMRGSWSENAHNMRSSNLRWRYVVREQPWFSTFKAGQISTTGLQNRSIRGASISNNPIEPRRIYETHVVDGTTEPDSEVELYLNNRLIDYTRADEVGYYRFEFPMTYGTTQLTLNIYTPTGETKTIDRRIQVPFTFLPPGEMSYNIQGGKTESFLGTEETERWLMHGNLSYGITDWLTAGVGSEYIEDFNDGKPFTYGSISSRLFSQYLVNIDIAPDAYYRGITSVMYPSGRTVSLQYTHFIENPLFSNGGANQDVQANFFFPFSLLNTRMGVRVGTDHRIFDENSLTRYRTDFSARIGRMNLRVNYRDVLYYTDEMLELGGGQLRGSLTYTFMRSAGIPVFVRGLFLRGNVYYDTKDNILERFDFQLSRTIRQTARLQIQAGYDLRNKQHQIRLGIIMDLNSIRTTTNIDNRSELTSVRQNIRGSLGFDHDPDRVVTSNRNQVGRAGASVILFVDNNNSGTYDEGDEIIPHHAIRLDRSAHMQVGRDGVVRISQLQSYHQYNLEVIRQSLPNPMLAPGKDEFSFIADPNRYKRIEIPFYRTGVIDGTVYLMKDGEKQPQSGLRLQIKSDDGEFDETIRNFSDGGFYAMDMPPGNYTIEVDPAQLDFLDAYMPEGPKQFEIKALSEGDFIEGLDIILHPLPEEEDEPAPEPVPEAEPEEAADEPDQAEIAEVPDTLPETTPDTAITAEQYVVEVGLYPFVSSAENARDKAAFLTEVNFHIREYDTYKLYIVFSEPVDNRTEATGILNTLLNEGFESAFIRELTNNKIYFSEKEPGVTPAPETEVTTPDSDSPFEQAGPGDHYYLAVNTFATIYRAETARAEVSQKLNKAFHIHFMEEESRFLVYSSLTESPDEALFLLNQLYETGFISAEVQHAPPPGPEKMLFQVQLAAFPDKHTAEKEFEDAVSATEVPLIMEQDSYSQRYVIRTEPFSTAPEAIKTLNELQDIDRFHGAFLISQPRLMSIPVLNPGRF